MATKNFTLPSSQIKDQLIHREVKQVKDALSDLPVMMGSDAPDGEVFAKLGTLYIKNNGQVFIKAGGDGTKDGWVLFGVQGSASSFTQGSVIFAGALGVLSQDNANLFWDDTNNRLGVGTATPGYRFDFRGPNSNITQFHIGGDSTDDGGYLTNFVQGDLHLSAGTAWDGTNWKIKNASAGILVMISGTYVFYADTGLTPGNNLTPTERMRLNATGLGVGVSPTEKLDVSGVVKSSNVHKAGDMENVGFSISGDTLTINQANGSAYADTAGNRGYVWLRSVTNGRIVRGKIVANVSLDIGDAHWGLDTKGDVTGVILRIYAINHGNTTDDFTPIWGIGYQGGFRYIRNTQDSTTATDMDLPEEILTNSAITTDNSPMADVGYALANFTDSGNTWAFTESFPGNSADGIWQFFKPAWTGFSSNPPDTDYRWTQNGRTIFVEFGPVNLGTSNATSFTATAPIKSKAARTDICHASVYDNTVLQVDPGRVDFASAGTGTFTIYKTLAAGAFTASGSKVAIFHVFYEAYQP